MWNVDQAYSELCHRTLFGHNQNLVQRLYTQKPGILEILEHSEPFHNCMPMHIHNPVILKKIYEYSEPAHILNPLKDLRLSFLQK